jgi:hypothetical protein
VVFDFASGPDKGISSATPALLANRASVGTPPGQAYDYGPTSRSEIGLEGTGQSYRNQRGAAIVLTAATMAADTTCRLPRYRLRQRIEHA